MTAPQENLNTALLAQTILRVCGLVFQGKLKLLTLAIT